MYDATCACSSGHLVSTSPWNHNVNLSAPSIRLYHPVESLFLCLELKLHGWDIYVHDEFDNEMRRKMTIGINHGVLSSPVVLPLAHHVNAVRKNLSWKLLRWSGNAPTGSGWGMQDADWLSDHNKSSREVRSEFLLYESSLKLFIDVWEQ